MAIEENLFANLPTDLIIEIFSRLPSNSVARFRCLSKEWASILTPSPYFTELFLSHTMTRPRLLLDIQIKNKRCLYSSPQPQIYHKNSTSVTAGFHMDFTKAWNLQICPPISGLIYCPNMPDLYDRTNPVLCNPATREILCLDHKATGSSVRSYFGYNPIDKRFRVLSISYDTLYNLEVTSSNFQVLNLGELCWRDLDRPLEHLPLRLNICINGVLYYMAKFGSDSKIVSFDLNSEKFKFIDEPWSTHPKVLVNFKGKLGGINMKWVQCGNKVKLELSLWVLKDFEKQEWFEHSYPLPSRLWNRKVKPSRVSILGLTRSGDVVMSLIYASNPFYVYFFNLERNILRKVEIKGLRDFKDGVVHGFVDYVEDLSLF